MKKKFCHWQIQHRRYGGPCSSVWFTENTLLGTSSNDKKADQDAKRKNKITFNPTYLTKVTDSNTVAVLIIEVFKYRKV